MRGALEHAVNTGIKGIFDSGSDLFSGGYEQRQKDLEELVAQENLQKPLKYLNYLNDATVNAYTLKKFELFKKIPTYIRMMYRNMKYVAFCYSIYIICLAALIYWRYNYMPDV